MPVNAIQQRETSPANYLKYMAIGSIGGYALKYAAPITPQEKDDYYKAELKRIGEKRKRIKQDEITELRKANIYPKKAIDTFVKMDDSKKLNKDELKKLPENLYSKVFDIKKHLDYIVRERIYEDMLNLKTSTKRLRPASVFIFIGAATGAVIALVTNILGESKRAKEQDYVMV